jgi:hypothetical protein
VFRFLGFFDQFIPLQLKVPELVEGELVEGELVEGSGFNGLSLLFLGV